MAVGIAVSTPDEITWYAIGEGLGPQSVFGWSWPITHDDPPFVIPLCPEVIDHQTEHLSDEELEDYLRVIEWMGQSHILFWREISDSAERQRRIEDEMASNYPASLEVWDELRLRVLDRTPR